MRSQIIAAMSSYNALYNYNFSLVDAIVLEEIINNQYKSDADLAQKTLCSKRTVARSIEKLQEHALINKTFDNKGKYIAVLPEAIQKFISIGV